MYLDGPQDELSNSVDEDIDSSIGDRDIIIETQSKLLQRIDVKHPLYLGLQYHLLFPYGEDGYRDDVKLKLSINSKDNGRTNVSMREFVSFRLQNKDEESQLLFQSRKLFQQFIVNVYTMIEAERLNFIRFNQPQLREDKPSTTSDIDLMNSAAIPDEKEDRTLFAAVETYMMHGPCGQANLNSPYMGKCSKHFSKKFCTRTEIDEEGFPHYITRDDGRTVKKKSIELYNRSAVPYNPKLLLKYQAYINIEYTCQTRAIKYLFKYIHKDNDRFTATFSYSAPDDDKSRTTDEIQKYYDCRTFDVVVTFTFRHSLYVKIVSSCQPKTTVRFKKSRILHVNNRLDIPL
ncbi:hypothetical protein Ddye_010033 [Dipteronia dyeriana]|uniref:Helitron helicase-like domain-containing protein n=1 Tax=Dipteronia dyeriana TaxID=168575 RepID=A0AAE0CMW4_9ROSI|nr:hypothetical protein Ddye_010033 [Dipteronia dyeriana]